MVRPTTNSDVLLAGVCAAVRSSADDETNCLYWSFTKRLRGHRHDAEGAIRLHQAQV